MVRYSAFMKVVRVDSGGWRRPFSGNDGGNITVASGEELVTHVPA